MKGNQSYRTAAEVEIRFALKERLPGFSIDWRVTLRAWKVVVAVKEAKFNISISNIRNFSLTNQFLSTMTSTVAFQEWIDEHQDMLVERLADCVAIPSISGDPTYRKDVFKMSEWLENLMVEQGVTWVVLH